MAGATPWSSLRWRQTLGQGVALAQFEVRVHFVGEFPVEPSATAKSHQPLQPPAWRHDFAPRNFAMSAVDRSQLATSTCNCRAPARVSV